jgi:Alcohol dehydrogenase GroES-like domain
LPEPAPGCVLVKMEVSGICGTDKHAFQGYTTQYAGSGTPKQIPFIQGHKNVGVVAAIGGDEDYKDLEGVPRHYPLAEFATHHFALRDVDAAVKKSIAPDSLKVVIEP